MRYRPPKKDELDALLLAGAMLSNIAFNLKQAPSRALTYQDCESMKRAQEAWDKARHALSPPQSGGGR